MAARVAVVLQAHGISVHLKGTVVERAKLVYDAILNAQDPLSIQEHELLFDDFWTESTTNKVKLSSSLRRKLVLHRWKIPEFWEVACGFLVRHQKQSLREICNLSATEEEEVWRVFHLLAPQFSRRDITAIDKVLGITPRVKELVTHCSPINVLDIGCGDTGMGISTLVFQSQGHVRGFGIDLDIHDHPSNVQLMKGSATRLPFADDFFHLVYACEVMYYFEHDALRNVLQEIIRTLRPGGLFVFNDFKWGMKRYAGFFMTERYSHTLTTDSKLKHVYILQK